MEKEVLIGLFDSSNSIAEICRKLYGKNNGGMHNRVLKLFEETGYDWETHIAEVEESKKRCCLNCGKEILGKGRSRKKFCNSSCAAQYNNKLREHTEETKSAIAEGLKKYNQEHLTDEIKWQRYCKRYNKNLPFEEYLEKVKDTSKNYNILKERQKESRYCIVCGKKLNGYNTMFCSTECRRIFEEKQYYEYIEHWKKGEEPGHTPCFKIHRYVKRYLLEKYNNSCQECGWNKENPYTGTVPLQIHHIDGDCTNNSEENLQLLCPNCHALTENFGSRNKNSKRVFRKQKLFKQEILK